MIADKETAGRNRAADAQVNVESSQGPSADVLQPALSHGVAAWLFAGAQVALCLLLLGHLSALVLRARHVSKRPPCPLKLPPHPPHPSHHAHRLGRSRPWRRLAQGGVALRLLRSLIFWGVLAWAATILVNHSLPG